MHEWKERQLKDIFPISTPGEWGAEPDGINNFIVLRAADFTKDCKLRDEIGVHRKIPVRKIRDRELIRGDILIEKSGGSPDQPVGRVVLFNKDDKGYSFSNFLQLLRVSADYEPTWAYYLLVSLYETNVVLNYQQQTTGIINLKLEEYLCEKVQIPAKKSEQQKIAHILTTVDNLIEKTQSLIDKYTAVKQGMMHDLFTRGVDVATGELRPSYEQAPQLYKETELGWVPREWEVRSFDEIAEFVNGNSFKSDEWRESGLPIIRIQNLNGENTFNYFDGKVDPKWKVKCGDLLFAWAGQRGVSFGPRIWSGQDGVLNQHIFKVTENPDRVDRFFLLCLLRQKIEVIEDAAHGFKDSFLHVTRGEITGIHIALPGKDEQKTITEKISKVERALDLERGHLKKYRLIKKGLMQDLLTGKVRVATE